jgi:choline dehydrogenase-like flavoprotein
MVQKNQYDVIVVGSGPGGATVAKELSAVGRSVLILEWGANRPITGSVFQAGRSVLIPGRSLLFTPDLAGVFRGIIAGGSTIFYYATAFDPPLERFKHYGIDLTQAVDDIRRELPTEPLDDRLVGPMATRIMNSARNLGYDWQKLPKFIDQAKCRLDCWRCNYGCPYQAKWNARWFVDQAVTNGACLETGVRVKKVLIESGTAVGVLGKKRGRTVRYYAPKVVIAAGGIGSPRILTASGFDGVGRDFFFDPLIAVMGTIDERLGGREIPMATGCHLEDEGYLMTDMTLPGSLHRLLSSQVGRFSGLLSHARTLTIMIKAKDDLGGRLTPRGQIRKRIGPADRLKLADGFERAKRILENAGAKNVYKTWYLAAHPGGTVKLGEFVDRDLQTERKNLYVCDCSVIPEVWGLPPTFSLVALGKRLAQKLVTT